MSTDSPPRATNPPSAARQAAGPAGRASPWFWPALAGLLAIGAVLRYLLVSDYLARNPFAHVPRVDALTYWEWAGRIAAGHLSDGVPFFSAPLYPYLLGLARAAGADIATVYHLQAVLLDSLTALLLALIGRRLAGAAAGLLAAALFLIALEPASSSLRLLTSAVQLPLVGRGGRAMRAALARQTTARAALAGAALGLLCLSHPPAMLALLGFAACCWWFGSRGRAARLRPAVALLAGGAAIAPATIHNYAVSGEFFAIQSVSGINFRQGNGPGAEGIITMIPGTSNDREELFRAAQEAFLRQHGREGSWKEIDHYYRDQALAYLNEDWARAAALVVRKLYWYFTARNFADIYSPTLEISEGLTPRLAWFPLHSAWLLPPTALACILWLRRPALHAPALLLFSITLVAVALFWFTPRYRVPAAPVMCFATAWVLIEAFRHRKSWGWPVATAAALAVGLGSGPLNAAIGFDSPERIRAAFLDAVGRAHLELGNPQAARDWLLRAVQADPRSASPHVGLAGVHEQTSQPAEALVELRCAAELEPRNPFVLEQLGRTLAAQQRLPEARAAFERFAALRPRDPKARNNLGKVLHLLNDLPAARREYETALKLLPQYATAQENLGDLLLQTGEIDAGLKRLRAALELAPNASLLNKLAWYQATLPQRPAAERAEALAFAQRVLDAVGPDQPSALDTLAAALAANERFADAVQTQRRAVELFEQTGPPESANAARERLRLYESGQPFVQPSD